MFAVSCHGAARASPLSTVLPSRFHSSQRSLFELPSHDTLSLMKNTMSSSASFSLKPITEDDIPALTKMESLTFESDRHTLLKAAHPTRPYDHAAGVPDMIKYRLSLPANKVELIKAVDDETGEILGHVCWGLRLSVPQPQPQPPEPSSTEQAEQGKAKNSSKLPARVVPQDYEKTNAPDLDSIAQLEELTSSHFADFMKRVMPDGTRCMYVVGLSVHPAHQLRGVGTALMRRGTDRADAEGVFCWVHSSEAAAGMYRKCGFEVDDTLEIDLDHWAAPLDIKPPAGDEKWGTYTFKYMIRQPRAVKDALSS